MSDWLPLSCSLDCSQSELFFLISPSFFPFSHQQEISCWRENLLCRPTRPHLALSTKLSNQKHSFSSGKKRFRDAKSCRSSECVANEISDNLTHSLQFSFGKNFRLWRMRSLIGYFYFGASSVWNASWGGGGWCQFFANEQLNVQLLRAVPFHQASSGSTGPRYFDCNWPEEAESAKESGERRQPDPLGRTNLHVAFARKLMARERDEMRQSVQFHGTFDTRHQTNIPHRCLLWASRITFNSASIYLDLQWTWALVHRIDLRCRWSGFKESKQSRSAQNGNMEKRNTRDGTKANNRTTALTETNLNDKFNLISAARSSIQFDSFGWLNQIPQSGKFSEFLN